MEKPQPFIEYVLRSGARTDVLLAIADGSDSTQSLLNRNLASESAVYNALTELENRGLIYVPKRKRWAVTGTGSVVADLIDRQRETERILHSDVEYWQKHDVSVLPRPFRSCLADLADGEIVRATDTQPSRAIREVERRLESATAASVISPVFNERYSTAFLDDCDNPRLVLGRNVFADLLADANVDENDEGNLRTRVADTAFALTVTDDCLLFSLPLLDGSYDARTEFVAESERARRWGTELFEYVWEDAESADSYAESLETNVR
ncbi:Predicted transcriptional regulator, contains HTH domain [Haladaptatus litoreus]|uniref:Predicted transcriptional regulator, contains HTH domain n=1 Tax=Haladaptatus litoreus TaxID=553468 RepID=A0A1N6YCW3_9EURY|nr:transcriptional regulator FilR1 domain-containing protein [Haladaptatus litoreus]SIR12393.1 Predicted transcriptional regulator, contains HTH domain [Haladaptatus litoreus]